MVWLVIKLRWTANLLTSLSPLIFTSEESAQEQVLEKSYRSNCQLIVFEHCLDKNEICFVNTSHTSDRFHKSRDQRSVLYHENCKCSNPKSRLLDRGQNVFSLTLLCAVTHDGEDQICPTHGDQLPHCPPRWEYLPGPGYPGDLGNLLPPYEWPLRAQWWVTPHLPVWSASRCWCFQLL